MSEKVFTGGCFCQEVRFEYKYTEDTKPLFGFYCHCFTCRKFASAPMQTLIGVLKTSFVITKGEEHLKEWSEPGNKIGMSKKFCSNCGCSVCQGPKDAPFYGTFPITYDAIGKFPENNTLPSEFVIAAHINCENTTLGAIISKDDVPKFKNFPTGVFDGTGESWSA